MATIRRSGESKCFSMARELAQHRGLSFEARGLMAYLLSKPTNWQAKLTDIEKEGNIGREQRRRIIGELEKAGYIERKQLRDEQGRINYEMIVHEDVLPEESRTCETDRAVTAQTETPSTGNPHTVKPQTETPSTYMNTEVQENRLTVAATPQAAALSRKKARKTPCPKCKQEVPILGSNGKEAAWCLTCGIDALEVGQGVSALESDVWLCIGFYKHEFARGPGNGLEARISKGKDYNVMKEIVKQYGKTKTQSLIRLFLACEDAEIAKAGYSVAFFSTRINSLLVARPATRRRPEIVT